MFAHLTRRHRDLKLLMPGQEAKAGAGNMRILASRSLWAGNPKDALTLMGFCDPPQVQAVLRPAGRAAAPLAEPGLVIGLPPSVTASEPAAFPSQRCMQQPGNYCPLKNQEEPIARNGPFLPMIQGT